MEGRKLRKYEIARLLARRFGYESYLEICTPYTGGTFSLVDKKQFSQRSRLMYRRPLSFSDGERVDFSTQAETGEELFSELVKSGERFDLVFVDPWHTYLSSLCDITFGLQLIKDNGALLIHDCNPPNAACAEPEYHTGDWCGVTFAAYLDVALFTSGIHYITVDSDYGCGIISKDHRLTNIYKSQPAASLASQWKTLNISQKYNFLDENRSQLLHLISADTFCQRFDSRRRRGARRIRRLIKRAFSID
jgi:hypothetical protein